MAVSRGTSTISLWREREREREGGREACAANMHRYQGYCQAFGVNAAVVPDSMTHVCRVPCAVCQHRVNVSVLTTKATQTQPVGKDHNTLATRLMFTSTSWFRSSLSPAILLVIRGRVKLVLRLIILGA
jgi:hypothetical protein